MDPNLYCVLLLAQMKNGKLQVASNYPNVGSKFITSELALRFANCTSEGKVFESEEVVSCISWMLSVWHVGNERLLTDAVRLGGAKWVRQEGGTYFHFRKCEHADVVAPTRAY